MSRNTSVRKDDGREAAPVSRLWNLVPTNDWSQDNDAGKRFADSCLRDMQKSGNPLKLQSVMKELIAVGRCDGTHVGFLHRISSLALKGSIGVVGMAGLGDWAMTLMDALPIV